MPYPVFEHIADRDWERAWLDEFKPVKVGRDLWVCPSWCQPEEPDHCNLMIDPGLAFGTGTHPTTNLCLSWLSDHEMHHKTVLDFGCGSGILGIAAAKLGAYQVYGTDVDTKAIETANGNAAVNQVSDKFRAMENESFFEQMGTMKFDLVVANILAGTLKHLAGELVARTAEGGQMLLSGILHHQADDVIASYGSHFVFEKRQMGDWMLLIGERRDG